MNNKSSEYWESLSRSIEKPSQTKNQRPDTSQEEADFVKRYLRPDFEVLDLGSGSGLIVNKIYPLVRRIIAVETYEGFSRFIVDDPRVLVINANLENFRIRKAFDVVTCTGVMQYFQEPDVSEMYRNMYAMLRRGGTLIMRTHCGLKETVVINHSDEMNKDYFAEYRPVDQEKMTLEKIGFSVQVLDEAPKALNIWENTHHFMFVCKK